MSKRGNDHTTLIIVIVLAVIIVGGGGLAYVIFSAELPSLLSEIEGGEDTLSFSKYIDAVGQKDPSLCPGISDSSLRDSCFHDLALALSDSGLCGSVSDNGVKDTCYSNMASAAGDILLCEEIANDASRKACRSQLSAVADCGAIGDVQLNGECYMNYVINNDVMDVAICDGIRGDEYRSACLAVTERDSSLCDGASGSVRDGCLSSLAVMLNQTGICDKITDTVRKGACKYATGGAG